MSEIRDVYGIRNVAFDERNHRIKVEYDSSRLSERDPAFMLRTRAFVCEAFLEKPPDWQTNLLAGYDCDC